MCVKNKKQEVILTPSYSMMHALEDGFSIAMYSGTHDNIMINSCVHINHAVKIILKKGQGVMWHEALYHSGDKSKVVPSGLVTPDLRLFMYLWPKVANNQRNRNVSTNDGFAREFGELLY